MSCYVIKLGEREFRVEVQDKGQGVFQVKAGEGGGRALFDETVDLAVDGPLLHLLIAGRSHLCEVGLEPRRAEIQLRGTSYSLSCRSLHEHLIDLAATGLNTGPEGELRAQMPGRVVEISVRDGQEVQQGQGLLIVEAMKMENRICASHAGRIERIAVTPGQSVETGQVFLVWAKDESGL